MVGMTLWEKLIVCVGIGICAVSDGLKRLVTREKPDVCPECVEWLRWAKEDLQPILDKVKATVVRPDDLARRIHEIHRLKLPEIRNGHGVVQVQAKPGDRFGSRMLGSDWLWHDWPHGAEQPPTGNDVQAAHWEFPVTEAEYVARLRRPGNAVPDAQDWDL